MGAEMTGVDSLVATTEEVARDWTGYYEREIGSDAEHAIWVEFGTKPHGIEPDTAGALNFTVDGTEVVTQYVEHPGTDPQPYMRPGAEAAIRQTPAITPQVDDLEEFTDELAEVVKDVARRKAPVETGELVMSIRVWEV